VTLSGLAGWLNWDSILTVVVIVIVLAGIIAAGTAWQIWISGKAAGHFLSDPSLDALDGVRRRRVRILARISIRFLKITGFHRLARQLESSARSSEKEA